MFQSEVYWASTGETVTFIPFQIHHISENDHEDYIERTMKLMNAEEVFKLHVASYFHITFTDKLLHEYKSRLRVSAADNRKIHFFLKALSNDYTPCKCWIFDSGFKVCTRIYAIGLKLPRQKNPYFT